MTLEAKIVEALQEGPLTKTELRAEIGAKDGAFQSALRRLIAAKDIELIAGKKGSHHTFKALRPETTIIAHAKGVQLARIWDPLKDPKPDFIRRLREGNDA